MTANDREGQAALDHYTRLVASPDEPLAAGRPGEPGTEAASTEAGPIHAPGCRCWPHVSQQDAVTAVREAFVEGARQEYVASREAASAAAATAPGIDVERLWHARRNVERRNDRAFAFDRDIDTLATEYDRLRAAAYSEAAPERLTEESRDRDE